MADEQLTVEFWDVGQGDASVLRIGGNRVIIIDVGPRNSPIIDWLIQNQSIYVESIILTHNDADHAGAMAAITEAAKFRINSVFFLQDRNKKERPFLELFSNLHENYKLQTIRTLRRLEAPCNIWNSVSGQCCLEVKYPLIQDNIVASDPNVTSGIITLAINGKTKVIWAGDSQIESVARECGSGEPNYMAGPHHGAPLDRAKPQAVAWLRSINAETIFLSVGSKNPYKHPQPSYIKKSLAAESRIVCTQLTKLCDKTRRTDVIKSHARLALPQPNTGICCRGPVRLSLRNGFLMGDDLDDQHQEEIRHLQRPRCLLLRPKK